MHAAGASSPRPLPASIGLLFGGAWAVIGAFALPPPWRTPMAGLGVLASLLLVALLWRLAPSVAGENRLFGRGAYIAAVVLEVIGIYGASLIMGRVGLQPYFLEVVGCIVGLHFIGLWAATAAPRYVWIGAAMCAVSLAAMTLPNAWAQANLRDAVVGFGNALTLWIGASQRARRIGRRR